jgi:hypothetical protein
MLYQKMEENSTLSRKLEQTQTQQLVFLSQMMQQPPAPSAAVQTPMGG